MSATEMSNDEIIEVQSDAEAKAKEILEKGEAFDYILRVWQKRHSGDALLGKALLFSIGCQSVSNSKGIHVAVTGESGYGKTGSCTCLIELAP
jgi:primase-polymerase (primpol)-like protein